MAGTMIKTPGGVSPRSAGLRASPVGLGAHQAAVLA